MRLENYKIIVTGGTKGIGAGCVRAYVREGAQVVFCGTSDERGKATEEEANAQAAAGGRATYIRCDISNREEVDELFAKALGILGGLDVLANVAGVERSAASADFTDEDIDFLFGVNVNGTIYTNQAAYRAFKELGTADPAIINYSSDTALTGMPDGAVYAASKAAVLGWTRTIASEWGVELNCRCNCVNPAIKTPMYEAWLANSEPDVLEPYLAMMKQRFPIDGDMGSVDRDLAPVMVFLASRESRYINGQVICVNGGLAMVR